MQFEQIKAITEKYGPVMEQLDRLASPQWAHGSAEYLAAIGALKLAVADQFLSEIKSLKEQPGQNSQAPVSLAVSNEE